MQGSAEMKITIRACLFTKWDMDVNTCQTLWNYWFI